MEQYLIDTNVISDYFSALFSRSAMALMDRVIDAKPNLSIITQIELLCWNTDKETMSSVQNFIADSNVLNIGPNVIAYCVSLRKVKK